MKKKIKLVDITFIIVTYRSNQIIETCLNFLPNESPKIIIENSNDISFKNKMEKNHLNLKCFLTEANLGYGAANNLGIKKSETEYVFILNPDVIIKRDNLNEIIEILNLESFDLAAPINFDDKDNYSFKENKILHVENVKGFAMIIKKDFFLKYLFDENIFLYLEEIDLCNRIRKDNGKIILLNSFVKHIGGNSHGDRKDLEMEKSRNWHWMWSKFYFYKKNYGYISGLIKTLPNFINCLIKYIFYKILGKEENLIKYKMRFLGLYNSYLLKKSYYRPYEKN